MSTKYRKKLQVLLADAVYFNQIVTEHMDSNGSSMVVIRQTSQNPIERSFGALLKYSGVDTAGSWSWKVWASAATDLVTFLFLRWM